MKKLFLALFLFPFVNIFGEDGIVQAFDIQAFVNPSGTSVTLKWELKNNYIKSVRRKLREDSSWGPTVVLTADATEYADNTVQNGKIYEYHVNCQNASYEYISVAVNAPLIDYRGKVLLLVEKSLNAPLMFEINRLMMDLRGDGWQVIKIDVDKTAKPTVVKTLIKNAYNLDKINTKAIYILGQVALPLSGCTAEDGHGDHFGAWATDAYYSDIDGIWTDSTANCTIGNWNPNSPGDGKFDQVMLPSPCDLQIGRVDMSNLAAFSESYVDLTKRYLHKSHNYRGKIISPPRRAIVFDSFNAGFSWAGYNHFNSAFGKNNIKRVSTTAFYTTSNLWGYACGPGQIDGFVHDNWFTKDFASKTYNVVFTMLYGSYLGDYQTGNNFMKGALASKGWILTCSWAYNWVYHHMSTGDNIGYSGLVNRNNYKMYYFNSIGNIITNLLGDPTLRQDIIAPPMNVKSGVISNHVKITWSTANDSIEGYHIYKSNGLDSVFTRVTTIPVKDTFWTDPAVAGAKYFYQVKAYRMEKGRCGNYGNTSRGILTCNDVTVKEYPVIINKPYVTSHIPDKIGYVKSPFYYKLPLATTFADDDPDDVDILQYEVYKSDGSALPPGWTFNSTTYVINALPFPSLPVKFNVVVKATDMTRNFTTDTFEISIIDTMQTSLASGLIKEFSLYPNPANNELFIDYQSTCQCTVFCTISDMDGKKIQEKSFSITTGINTMKMDVTNMPAGIYIIGIRTQNKNYQNKFIILK